MVPCRASGIPAASTAWILASKLFDATELYSTSDLLTSLGAGLNTQEPHRQLPHEFHHRAHLHRSTSHRLLNDELFIDLSDRGREQFVLQNLTASSSQHSRRFKRTPNKSAFGQFPASSTNEQIDWLNEHFRLKELPGLRYVRADGALVFPPFASSFYSPSVHHTGYVCVAWNSAGTVISPQINVKAGKFQASNQKSLFTSDFTR